MRKRYVMYEMLRRILLLAKAIEALLTRDGQNETGCQPEVVGVRFDGETDSAASERLRELYEADQNAREADAQTDWGKIQAADRARRNAVLGLLQAGQLQAAEDLFRAALIFQHGDCSDHYALAADLAWRAHESGYNGAGTLYAAALDRHRMSNGQFQIYGTQFVYGWDSRFHLCPVVGDVTDEERLGLGMPTLAEKRAEADELTDLFGLEPHPAQRWTALPLIGRWLVEFSVVWESLKFS